MKRTFQEYTEFYFKSFFNNPLYGEPILTTFIYFLRGTRFDSPYILSKTGDSYHYQPDSNRVDDKFKKFLIFVILNYKATFSQIPEIFSEFLLQFFCSSFNTFFEIVSQNDLISLFTHYPTGIFLAIKSLLSSNRPFPNSQNIISFFKKNIISTIKSFIEEVKKTSDSSSKCFSYTLQTLPILTLKSDYMLQNLMQYSHPIPPPSIQIKIITPILKRWLRAAKYTGNHSLFASCSTMLRFPDSPENPKYHIEIAFSLLPCTLR